MSEEQLLDATLEILSKDGAVAAYGHLVANKHLTGEHSGQMYNFLYCLAAVIGEKEKALTWMHQAIVLKGFWYRPDVFEDDDLDSIRNDAVFLNCKKISDARYDEAQKAARTICTWKEVKSKKLALALHGNQQNMSSDNGHWQFLQDAGYQLEFVQSKTIDSHALYRWDDDAKTQLDDVISNLPWDGYDSRLLCGFSAGCNEILKTLLNTDIKCEKVILQSPWIPIIDKHLAELVSAMADVSIEIICGENDDDCLPHAEKLAKAATQQGLNCTFKIIKGLGHSFPN